MPKTFAIIFGIADFLGGCITTTEKGGDLIAYSLGRAMVGILFGILFGWIWTKTKNKFIKTALVILSVTYASQNLSDIQSFMEKASFKHACAKKLRSKQKEASLFFSGLLLDFKSSFQEAKKVNLREVLNEIEERLNKEDATALTYFEELGKLFNIQEKISAWINDFDKNDVETLYAFLDHIFSVLKAECEETHEVLEEIRALELASNIMRDLNYSKEKLELFKKLMELGVKKFITHITKNYSTPEGKKQLTKSFTCKKPIEKILTKLVNTKLFIPIAEELIKEITQALQFADKTKLGFDLETYMKNTFASLKDTPEGQRKIIKDIKKLKDKCSLLAEAAIKEFCFD